MKKLLHAVGLASLLALALALGALRLTQWIEVRGLGSDRDDFLAANAVRAALHDYTGAQGGPCEDFTCVADVVRALRAEGELSSEVADYLERNREHFVWQAHERNFDVAWAITGSR